MLKPTSNNTTNGVSSFFSHPGSPVSDEIMGLLKRLLDGRRLGAFVLVVILGGSFNSHGVSALSVECFDPLLDFYLETGFDITRSYELVAKDSCKSQSANIQQLLTCTHGDNSTINVSCGNHSDSTQNRKFLYGNSCT